MRILFLNHNIRGRGTWFRCFHPARGLVRRGHAVTILTLSAVPRFGPFRSTSEGITIIEAPRWLPPGRHDGGWAPLDILSRIPTVLFGRWDVVHAFGHRPNVSLPWYLAKAFRNGLFVADWCDWWCRGGILSSRRSFRFLDDWEARLEEGTKRSAAVVTVISSVLRERALSIGIPEERILLTPSGADVESIRQEDRRQCREGLGLAPEGTYLGFIGFSVWDLRILFEAFQKVREKRPDARLVWVGKDKDGVFPELDYEFGFGDVLVRLGEVPYQEISKVLGAMDLHLLPLADTLANRARWPNKLGDYLASGRPTATMDVGDAGRFVKEHGVGTATAPTAEAFADGVLSMLEDQEGLLEAGKRSRQVAETVRPWDRTSGLLEELYLRLRA